MSEAMAVHVVYRAKPLWTYHQTQQSGDQTEDDFNATLTEQEAYQDTEAGQVFAVVRLQPQPVAIGGGTAEEQSPNVGNG